MNRKCDWEHDNIDNIEKHNELDPLTNLFNASKCVNSGVIHHAGKPQTISDYVLQNDVSYQHSQKINWVIICLHLLGLISTPSTYLLFFFCHPIIWFFFLLIHLKLNM